jgi:hypothetical protein
MDLTDIGKPEYRLYNAQQMRFVPNLKPVHLSAEELAAANEYFVRSFCPHLVWTTEADQPVRNYTIKR